MEHDTLHKDRRHPGALATDIMVALIIAVITSIVTAGATSYVTSQILTAQFATLDGQVRRNTNKIEKVSEEQQRRTWIVEQSRKHIERTRRGG